MCHSYTLLILVARSLQGGSELLCFIFFILLTYLICCRCEEFILSSHLRWKIGHLFDARVQGCEFHPIMLEFDYLDKYAFLILSLWSKEMQELSCVAWI